jgi:hypothetical protein
LILAIIGIEKWQDPLNRNDPIEQPVLLYSSVDLNNGTDLESNLTETFCQICTCTFATLYMRLPVLTNQNGLAGIRFDEERDASGVNTTCCQVELI